MGIEIVKTMILDIDDEGRDHDSSDGDTIEYLPVPGDLDRSGTLAINMVAAGTYIMNHFDYNDRKEISYCLFSIVMTDSDVDGNDLNMAILDGGLGSIGLSLGEMIPYFLDRVRKDEAE